MIFCLKKIIHVTRMDQIRLTVFRNDHDIYIIPEVALKKIFGSKNKTKQKNEGHMA